MTPEKIDELQQLQESERLGELTLAGTKRLHILRTELANEPELPDDPTTLTDEARRPLLAGGDYFKAQQERSCDEAKAFALQLAEKFGAAAAHVALEAAAAALKAR